MPTTTTPAPSVQRMYGIDPMFIYSETPESPMEVSFTCVFDPATATEGYSFELVRQHVAQRLSTNPAAATQARSSATGAGSPALGRRS